MRVTAYFTKENIKMFLFALNFSLSIFQTVKIIIIIIKINFLNKGNKLMN